jgi:hypothetical protein
MKAVCDQSFCSRQGFRHIRKQRVCITQNFELNELMPIEEFARQTQRPYRIIGRVTAGRIRQERELIRR